MGNQRPILMNGAMVRATLAGTKTQTRRVMSTQLVYGEVCGIFPSWYLPNKAGSGGTLYPNGREAILATCPYGEQGDRLWVRESWAQSGAWRIPAWPEADADDAYWDGTKEVMYTADVEKPATGWRGRPSIHMPRWASRIMLEITSVRIERLQGVSDADIEAEGIDIEALAEAQERYDVIAKDGNASGRPTLRCAWRDLWESTGGDWDANSWLWAISFRRVTP